MTDSGSAEPISALAQEVIDQIKSDHAKEVAALTKKFDEKCQRLSSDNSELIQENDQLHRRVEGMQGTINKKEKQIYLLTGGGAPAPEDPCNLCGRVGKIYAEDKGERTAQRVPWVARPWDSRQGHGPQHDASPQIIGNDQDGKHLLESNGGYMLKPTDGEDWERFQYLVQGAWERRIAGMDKESHRQLLKKRVPTDEEVTTPQGRRNIMTGFIKPRGQWTYDEWFTRHRTGLVDWPEEFGYNSNINPPLASETKQDLPLDDGNQDPHTSNFGVSATPSSEQNEQANAGEVDSHGWTQEEMGLANRPASGSDPWSQISPAWYGEATFVDRPGDNAWSESESGNGENEGDEGKGGKNDDDEGADGSDDADNSDGGSSDSDETVKAAS